MGRKSIVNHLLRLFFLFLAALLTFHSSNNAFAALNQQYRNLYSANSILFYNPDEVDLTASSCSDGSDITLIGDSISVLGATRQDSNSTGALLNYFPKMYVDALGGRGFYTTIDFNTYPTETLNNANGMAVLKVLAEQGNLRDKIILAMGANNTYDDVRHVTEYGNFPAYAPVTQEVLDYVHSLVGDSKQVYFITSYDKVNNNTYTQQNENLKNSGYNNFHVIDWASIATPDIIYNDPNAHGIWDVHPTAEGQQKWAELITSVICGEVTPSPDVPCLSGNTAEEIIWSGLLSVGFNEIQAASIMGNMAHESGFNPARRENDKRNNNIDIFSDSSVNYGVGLIQWSYGRRISFLNYMLSIDPNFRNYFLDYQTYSTGPTTSGNGFLEYVGKDIFITLVKHSLDFLWQEINTSNSYNGFFDNSSTLEQGTRWFLVHIESPNDIEDTYPYRITDAQKYYNQFTGNSSFGACDNTNGSSISGDGWLVDFPGYTKEDPYELGIALSEAQQESYTTNGPNKILLHSTEGSTPGISAYPSSNMFPAHFTIDLKSRSVSQHFSINKPALSIKSYDATGPIQIEIVGFSTANHSSNPKYLGNYTSEDWDYLAQLLKAIHDTTGIPLTSSVSWEPGTPRLSAEEFKNYTGILGHMHAPGNDHSDPGNFWGQISAAIGRL